MKNKQLIARAVLQALGVALYTGLVAWLMTNGDKIFGKIDGVIGPLAFLLLFVFSALVTGTLILGKPVMLYLDGNKKEAVRLFFYTGLCLFILLFAAFGVIIFTH